MEPSLTAWCFRFLARVWGCLLRALLGARERRLRRLGHGLGRALLLLRGAHLAAERRSVLVLAPALLQPQTSSGQPLPQRRQI